MMVTVHLWSSKWVPYMGLGDGRGCTDAEDWDSFFPMGAFQHHQGQALWLAFCRSSCFPPTLHVTRVARGQCWGGEVGLGQERRKERNRRPHPCSQVPCRDTQVSRF